MCYQWEWWGQGGGCCRDSSKTQLDGCGEAPGGCRKKPGPLSFSLTDSGKVVGRWNSFPGMTTLRFWTCQIYDAARDSKFTHATGNGKGRVRLLGLERPLQGG